MTEPIQPTPPDPNLHPLQAAEQERAVLIRIVRMAFFVLFVTFTALTILDVEPGSSPRTVAGGIAFKIGWQVVTGVAAGLLAIVMLIDALTTRRKIATLVSIFFGLLAAMLATYALGRVVDLLAVIYDIAPGFVATSKIMLGIGLAYLCIVTVLQTQDNFRLVIPYVEFAKQLRGPRPLLLDTSSLIDARIVDVCQTGIIQAPIVVPRFVISELQLLADSEDRQRRAKGRRGLDVISRLQRSTAQEVSIDETTPPGRAVDQMLVDMAKSMPAIIVTADTGLARVAGIRGVRVLNLNDVANALKPSLIPGSQLTLRLVKPGEQPGQAVGYLDDGTMVVAEDGGGRINEQVTLLVTSSLQTSAGRLIFARLAEPEAPKPGEPPVAPAPPFPGSPPGAPTPPLQSADPPTVAPQGHQFPEDDDAPRGPYPPNPPRRPNPARNPRR